MPAEKLSFSLRPQAVIDARDQVRTQHTEYLRAVKEHISDRQPHLFKYINSVMDLREYRSPYYENTSLVTYDILVKSSLPVNISSNVISEKILSSHLRSVNAIFTDERWEYNRWILQETRQNPARAPGEKPSPLSSFFQDVRNVSEPFADMVDTSIKNLDNPQHKKQFIRGVFDILNPYMALVDIQTLELDEDWQKTLDWLKWQFDSRRRMKTEEALGQQTSIEEIIIYAANLLSHPR